MVKDALALFFVRTAMRYHRTIRLSDTDAAGVVYFAAGLSLCHEAYEASLQEQGIDLKTFFRDRAIAVPIVHGEIDFFRPVYCGDRVIVELTAQQTEASRFEIFYQITSPLEPSSLLMQAKTLHVCIHPDKRQKVPLTPALQNWLAGFKAASNEKAVT